ncbi:MAG: ANTAR domain-containing protein [Pseudomonadota bacterium]
MNKTPTHTASAAESLRILLIDDLSGRAAILEQALSDAGHSIIARLGSTLDLPRQVQALQPDVVIIDLDSPDRDTLENMAIVSRDNPRPIIMFSAQDDSDTIQQAVRAGVSAYVVDGLSSKRVRPIIDVAIARFREFQAMRKELEKTRDQLSERKLVERAKGLLMKQRGFDEEEAYNAMRKMAMERNQRLVQIAQNVIDIFEMLG